MTILTERQSQILNFIKRYKDENGQSPSYREIMKGIGINSISAVYKHILRLKAKGAIEHEYGDFRRLTIVTECNQ